MVLVGQCVSVQLPAGVERFCPTFENADLHEDIQSTLGGDPLLSWFYPSSVRAIRYAVAQIADWSTDGRYVKVSPTYWVEESTPILAKFLLLALCRTVRRLAASMSGSNPTWTKRPRSAARRLRPSVEVLRTVYADELKAVLAVAKCAPLNGSSQRVQIAIGDSESLPLADGETDVVLTSPPYCTRIDYAVKTSIELSIMGFSHFDQDVLRRRLIGTTTVGRVVPAIGADWGETCSGTLQRISEHPSKASSGYYIKGYVQYFASLYASMKELSRVLKSRGDVFLVVQDSYYKEIHVDLPRIISEFGGKVGLSLVQRNDFPIKISMANLNRGGRAYRLRTPAVESVIHMRKEMMR